jgi:hypothetical protein
MSVMRFKPVTDPEAWYPNSFKGQRCYYCIDDLTSPFIVWQGGGDPVALHPRCVVELSIRLLRDVWEVECTSDTYITEMEPKPKPSPADQLVALRERLAARKGGVS